MTFNTIYTVINVVPQRNTSFVSFKISYLILNRIRWRLFVENKGQENILFQKIKYFPDIFLTNKRQENILFS